MSQQVVIDYQGVSIRVQAMCDTAIHSLCQIDKVLDRIHKTAKKLETEKVKEYEEYLMSSKAKIKKKIEDLKESLQKYQSIKTKTADVYSAGQFYNFRNNVEKEANELTTLANELTGSKLAVIDQMINEGLLNVGKETVEKIFNKINHVSLLPTEVIEKINQIEDLSLKELVYLAAKENNKLSFDEALKKGQEEYDLLVNKKTKETIDEYKEELLSKGVSTKELDNVKTIDEANAIANEAIVDEQVRKETLKIIIKAIKDRGFIVDTKNNLKIDREENVVNLVALKASGQKAEFEIQLNGKFMYHFDGYEGQACKKDIEPFIKDLKDIYDINILHEEVIWENPDKIQTQKYQYVNKNKGTN